MIKRWFIICMFVLLAACASEEVQDQKKQVSVEVLSHPTSVTDDKPFVVTWYINGTSNIKHTAIHFDYESRGPNFTAYREASAEYTGTAPQKFSANIHAVKVGFVFFRAHAIIDDEHYYSEEFKVEVKPYKTDHKEEKKECPVCLPPAAWTACNNGMRNRIIYVCNEETNFLCQDRKEEEECEEEAKPELPTEQVTIEVSDRAFNPSSLQVEPGTLVEITFKTVSPQGFGGADIRSSDGKIKTGKIDKGTEKTITFTMPGENIILTNYWPSASVAKTSMKINVRK